MPSSQINCHNFFFKFLPKISASWLPQFFFFSPLPFSATWLPQFIFSLSSLPYNFGNLVATIGFPLGTPHSTSTSGTSHSLGQQEFRLSHYRNSIFSPSSITSLIFTLSHTFSCNFGNTVAEIHSLSSFFQITLNSTYITNKLNFLQYSAIRLVNLCEVHHNTILRRGCEIFNYSLKLTLCLKKGKKN